MTITLWNYIITRIIKTVIPAVFCFMLIIEFIDLFSNINRYLVQEVPIGTILHIFVLYLPKALAYSISPALLFSTSYVLSGFYSSNELISVLNAGISFRKFILPVLMLGFVFSFSYFAFNETVVIPTYRMKEIVSDNALGYKASRNNSEIALRAAVYDDNDRFGIIYYSEYYNDEFRKIDRAVIFITNENNELLLRIAAEWGIYDSDQSLWVLHNAAVYEYEHAEVVRQTFQETYSHPFITLDPSYMQKSSEPIQNLSLSESRRLLERTYLIDRSQYRSLLTDYLERFSFSFTPLIVIMISSAFAWRFKKNILLFSILLSLTVSIIYYVLEMVTILFAKQGFMSPVMGAWIPCVMFICLGLLLLNKVKT